MTRARHPWPFMVQKPEKRDDSAAATAPASSEAAAKVNGHYPECPMAKPGHSERTWQCICGMLERG